MKITLLNRYKDYREKGGGLYITKRRKIINHYINHLTQRLLDGHEVYVPKIGKLRVAGSKWRPPQDEWGAKNTNWPATKKMWEEYPELKGKQFVVYLNEHSGGYWYKLKWTPAKRIKNIRAYKFTSADVFKEKLSKKIFHGQEYVNYKDLR